MEDGNGISTNIKASSTPAGFSSVVATPVNAESSSYPAALSTPAGSSSIAPSSRNVASSSYPAVASTSRPEKRKMLQKTKLTDVYDCVQEYTKTKCVKTNVVNKKNDIELELLLLKKRKQEINNEEEECRLLQERERLEQEKLRREQEEVKLEQEKIKLKIEEQKLKKEIIAVQLMQQQIIQNGEK